MNKLNRIKSGLTIGAIVLILIVAIFVISFVLNKDNKDEKEPDINGTTEYSVLIDDYIIKKIDIDDKKYINVKEGTYLILTKEGKIVDCTSEAGVFAISDRKSDYYSVSYLEVPVNIEGTIIEKGITYSYEFTIMIEIKDPFTLFEKLNIEGNMKTSEVFQSIFDEVLRENVNKIIIDYAKNENISLSEIKKTERLLNLKSYMLNELKSILDEEYIGIDFDRIYFTTYNIEK